MVNKFTQKQLERAYKQMEQERTAERKKVKEAADWVEKELGLGKVWIKGDDHPYRPTPFPVCYVLLCIHETYGPYLQDYTNKLDTLSWAKKNDEWVQGYKLNIPFYDIKTPFGDFKLGFEYWDNHCTGY